MDYSASVVLAGVLDRLRRAGVRVGLSNVGPAVRVELDRYGIAPDAWYDTSGEALAEYEKETRNG